MLHMYPNGDEVYIIRVVFISDGFSGETLGETDEVLKLKRLGEDEIPENINFADKENV